MKRKNFTYVLLFIVIIILLTSCKTAIPSSSVIKKDLLNQELDLGYGNVSISDSTSIENLKIVKKDINKQQRYYLATVNMELKNEDITLVGTGDIEYRYVPNDGWVIQDIIMDDDTVNIEINSEIDSDTLKSILDGTTLRYQSQNNTVYWEINDLNRITNVKVLETDKGNNGLSNKVKMTIFSKNSSEEFWADINLTLTYSLYDYCWNINDIEVVNAERKLYAGISKEKLKELLADSTRIYDIMKINFNSDILEYNWNIDGYDEIKNLDILSQHTDLKEYKDDLKVKITLEKDNLKLSNNLDVGCIYSSSGWKIEDITIPEASCAYSLLKEPTINLETLSKDLVGKNFTYSGNFFGDRWTIEEGELRTANIVDKLPLDYGNSIKYLVNIELKGSKTTINGNTFITYDYDKDNNSWEFRKIEKATDFEIEKNN